MRVSILSDQAVSPNLSAGDSAKTCAYPLSTSLRDGSICCAYRQGSSKHSSDSLLMIQTSQDFGNFWSDPQVVFDGRNSTPIITVVSASVCQTNDGNLLAMFGAIEGLASDVYMFSQEARSLPHLLLVTQSFDGGRSWLKPKSITQPSFLNSGVTSCPFTLDDGELCVPLEYNLTPAGPSGSAMMFSRDNGVTFDPAVIVAGDKSKKLNLCDARYEVLADGRIIVFLWTFRQDNEETIEVHRSFSSDRGRTWTEPEPIGFVGQITAPLALPGGQMVAVSNCRVPPEGICLWGSLDAGWIWPVLGPIQMWDPNVSRMVGQPRIPAKEVTVESEGVWEALDRFTFGTPDLVLLKDDSLLMTYYATLRDIIHVRACRFKVDWE